MKKGYAILGGLLLLLLTLKLTGVIKVSWLWIAAPLWWIPAWLGVLVLILAVFALVVYLVKRD